MIIYVRSEKSSQYVCVCVFVCFALTPKYSVVSRLSPDNSLGSGWRTSSVSMSVSNKSSCHRTMTATQIKMTVCGGQKVQGALEKNLFSYYSTALFSGGAAGGIIRTR